MSWSDLAYRRYLNGAYEPECSDNLGELEEQIALSHDHAPVLLPAGWRIVLSAEAEASATERAAEWDRTHPAAVPGGKPAKLVQRNLWR
jgi:hypothetical protein